jgi:tRNA (cytidine/uridine-2'-O-)-methyltransferase
MNDHSLQHDFSIALYSPRIAANVGAIGRLCAALSVPLHLIRPIPFTLNDQTLKRAGMDYWERVDYRLHLDFAAFQKAVQPNRVLLNTTKASAVYSDFAFQSGDVLLFGNEPHGVTDDIREAIPEEHHLRIPMPDGESRSLNLGMSCGIVAYEALRQLNQSV